MKREHNDYRGGERLVASAGEAWSDRFGFSRDGIGWDGGDFEGKAGEGRGARSDGRSFVGDDRRRGE